MARVIVITFHTSKVCLYDEVYWSRGEDMEGTRVRLGLLYGRMRRRRITGRWAVGRTNQVRGPYWRNNGLFVVLASRVSRGV